MKLKSIKLLAFLTVFFTILISLLNLIYLTFISPKNVNLVVDLFQDEEALYRNVNLTNTPTPYKLKSIYGKTFYILPYYSKRHQSVQVANLTICLATHATFNRLYWIPYQTSLWQGLVSVTVFVTDSFAQKSQYIIEHFHKCYAVVEEFVTFTLVFDEKFYETHLRKPWKDRINCEQFFSFLFTLTMEGVEESLGLYPQNLMRNIARRICPTTHTLNVDIDMISNDNLANKLDGFLKRRKLCPKCAYVIPVYEIKQNSPFPPKNKSELLDLIKSGMAQRYHQKVNVPSWNNTNLRRWESFAPSDSSDAIDVQYEVKTYEQFWEPVVIIHRTAHGFLERFLGYGFTRNSHIYLLHKLGFEFFVLDYGFLSHYGFQVNHNSGQRGMQTLKNKKIYYEFKKEVDELIG